MRDGYIGEDPAEFVETVHKSSEHARRPFTTSEIQRVISVADAEWKSLILFRLYTGQTPRGPRDFDLGSR
jgi:hypothetical protein